MTYDPHHDRIRYWETEAGVYDDEEQEDNE